MCGRFTFTSSKSTVQAHYGLLEAPDMPTSYNIHPSFNISIVRRNHGKELALCHWGLIPHWAKDKKLRPINARADTIAKKPMFRDSFKNRRCLIPANGYYEWKVENGKKQPYYIRVKKDDLFAGDDDLFSFAGIWSSWQSPDEQIESCAIITTEANPDIEHIHDRMPVIIHPDNYDRWLKQGGEDLLTPYVGFMESWKVSTKVNIPKNQGAELIEHVP